MWVEPVPCRSCIKQLPSDVRDGDKRLLGQAVAEAADRVSNRAGLVNLDIIDTPLTAFFPALSSSIREERSEQDAPRIHMLMCNSLSVTLGRKRRFIYMAKASLGFPVKRDTRCYRRVSKLGDESRGLRKARECLRCGFKI